MQTWPATTVQLKLHVTASKQIRPAQWDERRGCTANEATAVEEEKVPRAPLSVSSSRRLHCCSNTLSLLCSVFSPSGRASLGYWNSRAALTITLHLTRQHDKQIHLLNIPCAASVARNCSVPFRHCFHFCGSHGRKWNTQLSASVRRDRKTICREGFRRNLSKGNGFFLFFFLTPSANLPFSNLLSSAINWFICPKKN